MGIILSLIIFLFIASSIVLNNKNTFVVIQDRSNKKLRFTDSTLSFKKPYPIEEVVGRVPFSGKLLKYIEVGNIGLDFELLYTVENPILAYEFLNGIEDYIFEFIYNVVNLEDTIADTERKVFDKLSNVMDRKGIKLNQFKFK